MIASMPFKEDGVMSRIYNGRGMGKTAAQQALKQASLGMGFGMGQKRLNEMLYVMDK